MTSILKSLIQFWRSGIRQISIPFLFFSIIVAFSLFLGSKFLARWSRAINDEIQNLKSVSQQPWDIDSVLRSSPVDIFSLVRPYYWEFTNEKRLDSKETLWAISDSTSQKVAFENDYALLSWLLLSGKKDEEFEILKRGVSKKNDSEDKLRYLSKYIQEVYYPLVVDLVRRGDYYTAKEYLDRAFEIYGCTDEYFEFYRGMNQMYVFNMFLQDCWNASTHRSIFDEYCEETVNIEDISFLRPQRRRKEAGLSYIDYYFDGLVYLQNKEFDKASSCFKHSFIEADYEYVQELTSLMIIRSAVWRCDRSDDKGVFDNAMEDIELFSKYIKRPYFMVDIVGYIERLEDELSNDENFNQD